jgi:hypothetical protein
LDYEKENEMQTRILSAVVIAAAGFLSVPVASAMPINGALSHAGPAQIEHVRWRGGGRHHGWHGGGGWGYGLGGFAAGALIGSALAQPYGYYPPPAPYYYPPPAYAGVPGGDEVSYCMQRFRSYDPRSGTYLGYDGARHPCP